MGDSLSRDSQLPLGLSSYRASLQCWLSRMVNPDLTDEQFLYQLSNGLNAWFLIERSAFKCQHLTLLAHLTEHYDLQCKSCLEKKNG
jgi:hypothetical protein